MAVPKVPVNLQRAANIPGEHDLCASLGDVARLAFAKGGRHFRLGDVVAARSAAAVVRLVERGQLELIHHRQQLPWLAADFLRVGKAASIVINSFQRHRVLRFDWPQSDKEFADVLHLAGELFSFSRMGVFLQNFAISLQHRAASTRIGNNRV